MNFYLNTITNYVIYNFFINKLISVFSPSQRLTWFKRHFSSFIVFSKVQGLISGHDVENLGIQPILQFTTKVQSFTLIVSLITTLVGAICLKEIIYLKENVLLLIIACTINMKILSLSQSVTWW